MVWPTWSSSPSENSYSGSLCRLDPVTATHKENNKPQVCNVNKQTLSDGGEGGYSFALPAWAETVTQVTQSIKLMKMMKKSTEYSIDENIGSKRFQKYSTVAAPLRSTYGSLLFIVFKSGPIYFIILNISIQSNRTDSELFLNEHRMHLKFVQTPLCFSQVFRLGCSE